MNSSKKRKVTIMENHGKSWTIDEENKMLAVLAQTKMISADCDVVFANMVGRTPRAIYFRRVQIAQRLLKIGHPLTYLCMLLNLQEVDIIPVKNNTTTKTNTTIINNYYYN